MRLVTFETKTAMGPLERLGALLDGSIVDLNAAYALSLKEKGEASHASLANARLPADILGFLDLGEAARAAAQDALNFIERLGGAGAAKAAGPGSEKIVYQEGEIRLLSPLPRPRALRDFFAFEDHALQGSKRRGEPLSESWYDQPVYYKGNHREIYGPGETVPWPSYTRRFDFELEIACIVGKKGRDLTPQEAAGHIAGYCIMNDFSARDIQKNEMICRMGPAKGKDFATGLGPCLVTTDELPDPDNLAMAAFVNGEKWSEGNSSGRYWSFPVMLSHVSQEETVYPGDVLGSGTYYRGCGLDLDRWVKPGDVIELVVEKLGRLRQTAGAPRSQTHLKYSKAEARINGAHH
ncbi:MAG: fumarylacetoacetate hydrolase family protein [Elusimicrobia bacterium]|nr:fumarylacetoacetate hydrolase family protein [Elusimicrobiota bacterium]MDE2314146.1 fumarylacetoacetate hydrolase family protein [Elusimicrobiota bacterium]